jgi:hypothetical protein
VLGALEHSDVPFHHILKALNIGRDTSRAPVFQVMVVLQDASFFEGNAATGPLDSSKADDEPPRLLTWQDVIFTDESEHPVASFTTDEPLVPTMVPVDLQITFIPKLRDGSVLKLDGFISYRTDLFDRATVQKLVREFLDLLVAPCQDD